MTLHLVVALVILNSIAQRGSKVVVSLYALDLGAGAATVGLLAAGFALFPLLLAVQVGRISDRYGVRMPIALGMRIMANKLTQIAVPLAFGGVGAAMGATPVFLATGAFLFAAGMISARS